MSEESTPAQPGSAEEQKLRAEAEKAIAEAQAARDLSAFHIANANKAKAEASKADLEGENLQQQNRLVKIAADAASREEEDHLAGDRFHHLYNFGDSVSAGSVKACIAQLTQWMRKNPKCDIEIVFNSPGGSIVDGMALYDFIQLLKDNGHNVTTSALGMAASMAGILLQAGTKRVMGRQAWLMIHEASFGSYGKIGEVEDTVEWVKKVQERIIDIFAERSNLTKTQIRKNWLRKDWWLSADDALKHGFVDELR